uniref:hypothetical protein n=1 Tax=uncultured Roseobacter sp. TaxID=114847 RepID=UPI002612A703
MLATLRDLPDGAIGLMAAGTLHFALCYGVLAPRAMEAHFATTVTPRCTAMLSEEQEAAVSEAQREDSENRNRVRNELQRFDRQIAAVEQMQQLNRKSGLSDLMGALGVPAQAIGAGELTSLKRQADALRAALNSVPDFSHLRADASQLLRTCSCDPPPLEWSSAMFRKTEEYHGKQATK